MVFANSRYDLSTPVFDEWVARMMPTLTEFRRQVHRNPELSFREVKTTERIMNHLRGAGMSPVACEGTGCYVDIGNGPFALALRADIDALPIEEQTGLEYASAVPGVMHACGHDIHQTIMLGVALALHELNERTPLGRSVRILFQPAEEQLPGGAVQMIDQGLLRGVPRAFALRPESRFGTDRHTYRGDHQRLRYDQNSFERPRRAHFTAASDGGFDLRDESDRGAGARSADSPHRCAFGGAGRLGAGECWGGPKRHPR